MLPLIQRSINPILTDHRASISLSWARNTYASNCCGRVQYVGSARSKSRVNRRSQRLSVATEQRRRPKSALGGVRRSWGDEGDSEAEAVKNLALGVEENYRNNAAVIACMFRGQIAATICFGFAVIMLAVRVIGD